MSGAIDGIQKFITDLALHFSTPKHVSAETEKAWLESMVAELRGYAPSVLDRASRRIVTTRKYRNFPLVAECRQACREAAEEIAFDKRVQTLPALREAVGDGWSSERVKLAHELIKSGLGKQAANDNPCWVLALWHFCRKHQRLPAGSEIERCKKSSREFDAAYRECVIGGWPQAKMLESLGANMLAKREKMRAEVLGR